MTSLDWQKRFRLGLEQFNAGEFFECHETLESCWREQAGEEREVTQGVIQIAVAWYHLERGNVKGALRLFDRALPRLTRHLPAALGIDLSALVAAVENAKQVLQTIEIVDGRSVPLRLPVEIRSS